VIEITDEQFQKTVRGGSTVLDRAAIVTLAVSVREDLPATPMIRCDVAYGFEDKDGEFDPWDYNNAVTTIPVFIEGPGRFGACIKAKHDTGPAKSGIDIVHFLLEWAETRLVASGKFGPHAEIIQAKPKALKAAEG